MRYPQAVLIFALLAACQPEGAEPPGMLGELIEIRKAEAEINKRIGRAGHLLAEIESLNALASDYEESRMVRDLIDQKLATSLSFAGDSAAAIRIYDRIRSPRHHPDDHSLPKDLEPIPALKALLEASKDARAVFINEAHHIAQHRALTHRLLPHLRDMGFEYFAAETLNFLDNDLKQRGYAVAETGPYLQEPLYADLIRRAIDLGYKVVAYEAMRATSPAEREREQAENLIGRILERDPDARILVHLGYGHNLELADAFDGSPAMAFHFRQLSGINPLTIDQTVMSERGRRELEHPLYLEALAAGFLANGPVVFKSADGTWWKRPGDGRDITVFNPRSAFISGRPDWMSLGGSRRWVALESHHCPAEAECLVEAFIDEHDDDALPIDRIRITGGEPASLVLFSGTFRVQVSDRSGSELGRYRVIVKED